MLGREFTKTPARIHISWLTWCICCPKNFCTDQDILWK
jgi:hypothetical protein